MTNLPSIEPYRRRYREIDAQMTRPDFFQDQREATRLTREHTMIGKLLALYEDLGRIEQQLTDNRQLLAEAGEDPDIREMAEAEIPELEEEREQKQQQILRLMIPPEETDSRNTILEVRAGAGGDEASLFAGDLYRMYLRWAENKGFRVETMSFSESECGGFKEVVFRITGEDVYKLLKFESGVHRVQRIPVTEAGGRIHTSTVTVAVLPEAEEVDVEVNPEELEITTCRASGAGGQHVNTTDSAVQILHKPTGMIVQCADERSQIKNRAKAMTVLRSRLLQKKEEEERAKYAANRKSQVGTGDRSERIRTYNYPQSRVTDHRIGLNLQSLPQIMEGEVDELLEALQETRYQEKIEELLAGEIRFAGGSAGR
ncbi:MAG: peptide chain release factor 1 [Opitutales bacterium]|nr:peptide chain release factor 1 [Opitutales bacterium]MCH8541742.1 peptide chain release factor 1 [Opitutales bacterium]